LAKSSGNQAGNKHVRRTNNTLEAQAQIPLPLREADARVVAAKHPECSIAKKRKKTNLTLDD